MKQIHMKNMEGREYVFPRMQDEDVDAQMQSVRMEMDSSLIPVVHTIHPLKIGLWSADLLTLVSEMEIRDV